MQALCTRGQFIYCIVIRPLIEYCDGPLFVGGCIVTVQCTLRRAVCSCMLAVWLWSLLMFRLSLL